MPCTRLAEDVVVEGLALADGGVQADHHQRLRHVGLGQQEHAHNRVVLDAVVLGLCSKKEKESRKLSLMAQAGTRAH